MNDTKNNYLKLFGYWLVSLVSFPPLGIYALFQWIVKSLGNNFKMTTEMQTSVQKLAIASLMIGTVLYSLLAIYVYIKGGDLIVALEDFY